MKYFTKEWCFSNLEEAEIGKRIKSYKDYIDKIYEKLPFTLKILAKTLNIHDGIIKKVTFDMANDMLILEGVFGDLQVGYFSLKVNYINVSNINTDVLISNFRNQKVNVLSDEIEMISKNRFSHKMFFSTKKETEILFEDMEIAIRSEDQENFKTELCQIEVLEGH